jgi:hypothetical protein
MKIICGQIVAFKRAIRKFLNIEAAAHIEDLNYPPNMLI